VKSILAILFLFFLICYGQQGVFPHQIYTIEKYKGNTQNWSAVQDKKGRLYFANTGSILEFNGTDWDKINVPTSALTTAIAIDSADNIYAGGYKEFGLLQPTLSGNLKFKSLLNDSIKASINRVWSIKYTKDSGIYAVSNECIFRYFNSKLTVIEPDTGKFFNLLTAEGRVFCNGFQGLLEIQGNKIKPVLNSNIHKVHRIRGISSYDENNFLGLSVKKGVFLLNKKDFSYQPLNIELNQKIKSLQPYAFVKLKEEEYAIVTNLSGIIVIDRSGSISAIYDDHSGASDNVGINAFMGKDQILWFLGNNGLSSILHNFSIDYINEESGLSVPIYNINQVDSHMIAHTATGVQIYKNGKFKFWVSKRGQSWLGKFDEEKNLYFTIIGSNLYAIKNDKIAFVDSGEVTYTFLKSRYKPNTIYKPYEDHIEILNYDNNKFNIEAKYKTKTLMRDLAEVGKDSLLFLTEDQKIGLIVFKEKEFEINYFGSQEGVNEDKNTNLLSFKNEKLYIFQNDTNYFLYNKKNATIEKFNFFSYFNVHSKDISVVAEGPKDQFAYLTASGKVIWAKRMFNGSFIVDSTSFNLFGKNQGYSQLYFDDKGNLLICSNNKIYRYNPNSYWNIQREWETEITKVTIAKDSAIFNGHFYKKNETNKVSFIQFQNDDLIPNIDYDFNELKFRFSGLDYHDPQKTTYSYKLQNFDNKWSKWSAQNEKEYTNLFEGNYTFQVKAKNVFGRESQIATYKFNINPPAYRTIWAYAAYVLSAIGIILIIIRINERRLKSENERLEKVVTERTKEIEEQKEEIQQQANILNETNALLKDTNLNLAVKNKSITDSINYAKRIQDAMLPKPEQLNKIFYEKCLFYKPKDIVGGDFYWVIDREDSIYWAVIDCTGHGVPGGFMSMIGNSILNEIVSEQGVEDVNAILDSMREKVIKSISGGVENVNEAERKDGMDVALCRLDKKTGTFDFAGANLNAWVFQKGELIEVKGDMQPVGVHKTIIPFQKQSLSTQKGDVIYIFTDGYPDQFGGSKFKKFKLQRMRKLLTQMQDKTMLEQETMVAEVFNSWKGENSQTDDVTFIGIKT